MFKNEYIHPLMRIESPLLASCDLGKGTEITLRRFPFSYETKVIDPCPILSSRKSKLFFDECFLSPTASRCFICLKEESGETILEMFCRLGARKNS